MVWHWEFSSFPFFPNSPDRTQNFQRSLKSATGNKVLLVRKLYSPLHLHRSSLQRYLEATTGLKHPRILVSAEVLESISHRHREKADDKLLSWNWTNFCFPGSLPFQSSSLASALKELLSFLQGSLLTLPTGRGLAVILLYFSPSPGYLKGRVHFSSGH